jgi:TldD protein
MTTSRRDFLKTAGIALGAVALAPWAPEAEARAMAAIEADKNRLADLALAQAKKLGATYADIRISRYRTEAISTRERQVQNVARNQNFGFGVRVLVGGTWGFAASPDVNEKAVAQAVRDAVAIAKANSQFQRKKIMLAPAARRTPIGKAIFRKTVRRFDRR